MDINKKALEDTIKFLLIKYSNFGSDIANVNIEYRTNLKYHTAATDGKNIYIDPNYFESLSKDDKIFLIAHELMHIKLKHPFRLLDKNGNKRDLEIWNEATDAIINKNLERDGFTIKEGYINRPDALKYSANELYEIIKKEKENGQNNKKNNYIQDDHSLWEESFEKQKNKNSMIENEEEIDENKEFSKNRHERRQKDLENLQQSKQKLLKKITPPPSSKKIELNNVGESNHIINWQNLLRREVEKEELTWSRRRSIKENNYAYRLYSAETLEEAETEVMIDISGSVSLKLVKAFLRIIKPILNSSKLKVGCFNERFWGMTEINTNRDIDNFKIPEEARGSFARTEDWDLAVRSFTKKSEINKIVFTDGWPGPGKMPKEDLKYEKIIWIVYGNRNFKPICGKVIQITEDELKKLNTLTNSTTSKRKR